MSTVGKWAALALLLPMVAVAQQSSGAPDIDALLQRLAKPAPATTPFVEVHFSPLLTRPLIVAGVLEYGGPDSLARTVQKPYSEHTEIRGDQVTVVRGTGRPRTFSLRHAPELKILLSSFAALLGGNRQQLEQNFSLALTGDESHWSIGLNPRDHNVSQHVVRITLNGQAGSPRCMSTVAPDGSVTVMLIEAAAATPVAPDVDRAGLEKVCH